MAHKNRQPNPSIRIDIQPDRSHYIDQPVYLLKEHHIRRCQCHCSEQEPEWSNDKRKEDLEREKFFSGKQTVDPGGSYPFIGFFKRYGKRRFSKPRNKIGCQRKKYFEQERKPAFLFPAV